MDSLSLNLHLDLNDVVFDFFYRSAHPILEPQAPSAPPTTITNSLPALRKEQEHSSAGTSNPNAEPSSSSSHPQAPVTTTRKKRPTKPKKCYHSLEEAGIPPPPWPRKDSYHFFVGQAERFICNKCRDVGVWNIYETADHLAKHSEDIHKNILYTCTPCEYETKIEGLYRKHFNSISCRNRKATAATTTNQPSTSSTSTSTASSSVLDTNNNNVATEPTTTTTTTTAAPSAAGPSSKSTSSVGVDPKQLELLLIQLTHLVQELQLANIEHDTDNQLPTHHYETRSKKQHK